MLTQQLIKKIIEHEGKRKSAYQDSLGYWTIGIGRLCDKRMNAGLSEDEMAYLLHNDLEISKKELSGYDWFNKLDEVRQGVLIELHFNMGIEKLLGFKQMIDFLKLGYYLNASTHLLKSLWAKQVGPNRSTNMANRLKNGTY